MVVDYRHGSHNDYNIGCRRTALGPRVEGQELYGDTQYVSPREKGNG